MCRPDLVTKIGYGFTRERLVRTPAVVFLMLTIIFYPQDKVFRLRQTDAKSEKRVSKTG